MTEIIAQPTDRTTGPNGRQDQTPAHPVWDHKHYCQVDSGGDHIRVVAAPQRVVDGYEILVGVSADSVDIELDSANALRVLLICAANGDAEGITKDNRWTLGEHITMEPEEARLLARRLLAAAADWDTLQTGGSL